MNIHETSPETSHDVALAGRSMPPLYYLHPLMLGPLRGWGPELARIAGLGFGGVAIPPVFATGASGNLFHVSDHDRPHPLLEAGEDGTEALSRIAAACRAEGLALCLDLIPERVAEDSTLRAQHPGWFADPAGRRPDPRTDPALRGSVRGDLRQEGLATWWAERLRLWTQAGVSGFRCEEPEEIPPEAWRRLIAAAPGARFIAWTTGLPRDVLPRLAGLGFAATASSAAWWDYRSPWLFEERDALAVIAPPLAFPEAPFGTRVAVDRHDPALRERIARRALAFAAGFGDGLLVPMGFEAGARTPLDPAHVRAGDWTWLRDNAPYDLSAALREATALARRLAPMAGGETRSVAAPGAPVAAVLRLDGRDARAAGAAALILANPDVRNSRDLMPETVLPELGGMLGGFAVPGGSSTQALVPGTPLRLEPGGVVAATAKRGRPILRDASELPAEEAVESPRIAIEAITPVVDDGRFPAKRIVGEVVAVEADIFTDGHGKLNAALLWRAADETEWREAPMTLVSNDRWSATFPLERLGRHVFAVEGWIDVFAAFRDELGKKHTAGVPVHLELEEGRRLVAAAADRAGSDLPGLAALAARLLDAADAERLALLLAPDTAAMMASADDRPHRLRSAPMPVEAERTAARFASWYEIFPRSQSGDPKRHGTFDDVIGQLPRIRAMGFDVLYFPPIHPIGRKNRKGRNNTLTPGPDDPGSPYAIGSEDGGHEALHPELGSLEDFERLRQAAADQGLELAMDFAIQCSPDHPWLREHPEWFDWRPDGTIKYAENPPKKYEDIVNVDFYAEGAMPSLWIALRDSVLFWAERGIRTFRVDNPHTKPLPFWEWMIAEVKARFPDTIFLSEAFTRPKVMYRLAKVGYSQSYTYFTWRNTKAEMQEYLTELTTTAPKEFFRPHFFVNTPDINPKFLQTSSRPGHLIRAALAATLSGLWGVYNGFELCEATPVAPGKEEYLDSEKYEIRAWDHDRPGNIVAEITRLNAIRRENPALHSHLGVTFHNAFNDSILYFGKATPDRSNCLLVAVSMDPFNAQEASFEVPLWEWGLPDHASIEAEDLMRGNRLTFAGKTQHLRLDPADLPFAIWRLRPTGTPFGA
ncbi:maltotransferase domain-containing protein [Roseomonas mucosa]|uniref:maltotransferase domain-containing protein n=1 Tax=Roseomonas mucosa TaxID=207340 RepID=UPI0028CEF221|nr:maltotransferase domain-containing protein [Roseomonas mucosa]MDT8275001.1 maltotransferase domain-containing protein [Roseomonas mucosa]